MAQTPRYNVILRPQDLRRDVMRAGGPGGQHQNKTESAVRYTHLPTGISAESRSDRSQHANDALALERLKEKLLAVHLLRLGRSARDAWERKPEATFGSQMRTYRLTGNPRVVTDHETGWQGDPGAVLDGRIDDLLRERMIMSAKEQWESGEA